MTAMNTGMNSAALDRLMVFTGNANARLAQDVVKHLNLSLGRAIASKFSDGCDVAVAKSLRRCGVPWEPDRLGDLGREDRPQPVGHVKRPTISTGLLGYGE